MANRTLNVLCNALADAWCALALAVCAHALDLLEQLLCACDDVRLVAQAVDEDIFVLEQVGVLEQTGDLAEKGNGLLVQLLGVANVGCNDGVERQVFALTLCQLRAVRLRLYGQLAAHRILGRAHMRVDVVQVEDLVRDSRRHGS